MKRLFANLAVIVSICLLPYWVAVIVGVALLFFFDFVEIIFYGFVLDVLYGMPPLWSQYKFGILASFVYVMIVYVKPYIKS